MLICVTVPLFLPIHVEYELHDTGRRDSQQRIGEARVR